MRKKQSAKFNKTSTTNSSKNEIDYKKKFETFYKKNKDYFFHNPFLNTSRQQFASSLFRIKIFEYVQNVKGSIVECGVHQGNHLMLFYHLLLAYEPTAFNDKIIGFDTFDGFRSISKKDPKMYSKSDFNNTDYKFLKDLIEINRLNDVVKHIPRVELIMGDAVKTIPKYVRENKSLIIRLLFLDFDLYKPTIVALENLYKLVPSGGIIAFSEVGTEKWHGETTAIKEFFGDMSIELKKFSFDPFQSYYIKK